MSIQLQRMLSTVALPASTESQLVYVLLHALPQGAALHMPKLPLNICLLIDRSSSMRGERLQHVKDAVGKIIDQLGPDDYFSVVVFNDRAEVVVPAQRITNRTELKRATGTIEAAGGTEMAMGMALALQEVQRPMLTNGISRIVLLTDGRTYGDESRCVEIARRAQDRGIGMTALGLGSEWNEDLLETMTARENSRALYITSAQGITAAFAEELQRMNTVFAQRVRLDIQTRPGALVRSLDRVRPYIGSLPASEIADMHWQVGLGDWPNTDPQSMLMELVVPPVDVGEHALCKLTLRYDMPSAGLRDQTVEDVVRVRVVPPEQASGDVEPAVRQWLERVVAYRLQSRAWQDVQAGRIEEATRRLQMAGTRLFEAGEVALARTVQEEATRLLRSGSASEEGRKRIRFGTRGLISRDGEPGGSDT